MSLLRRGSRPAISSAATGDTWELSAGGRNPTAPPALLTVTQQSISSLLSPALTSPGWAH
jgi:hypothetical protein